MKLEDVFATTEIDASGDLVRFAMIEDEHGDEFWALGHVDPDTLRSEVVRWLDHIGSTLVVEDDPVLTAPVYHVWAKMRKMREGEDWDYRFDTVPAEAEGAFPVSRLSLWS